MNTTLRPELVGRDFQAIEFLLARIAEDLPAATGSNRLHLVAMLAVVNQYQDTAVQYLRRERPFSELGPEIVDYGKIARGYAREWDGHPDFHTGWNAP